MSDKAKNCGECVHFTNRAEYLQLKKHCKMNHNPRYFIDPNPDKGGWKRRCEDFKAKEETT